MKTAITLCGSLRQNSINEVLRRHMSQKLREADVEVTDLDLGQFEMPVFHQDLEPDHRPEAARRLADDNVELCGRGVLGIVARKGEDTGALDHPRLAILGVASGRKAVHMPHFRRNEIGVA